MIRARSGTRKDCGAATVEFVLLVVALLVPLTYTLITALTVQRAAYGVAQAAREAARGYVTAPDGTDGAARAQVAADLALRDQGLDPNQVRLVIDCSADPCLTPKASIVVTVGATVALPWVPDVLGQPAAEIPVSATYREIVDPYTPVRP